MPAWKREYFIAKVGVDFLRSRVWMDFDYKWRMPHFRRCPRLLSYSCVFFLVAASLPVPAVKLSDYEAVVRFQQHQFGRSVSVRANKTCSVIHSPRVNKDIDEANGFRLAGHNMEELRRSLVELKNFSEDAVEGRLSVTQVPMWSREGDAVVKGVRQVVRELNLEDRIDVKAHYVSEGQGLRKVLERLREFLPMRQDYEKPLPSEVYTGLPGLIASEWVTASYMFAHFPPEIAVPMSSAYFGFLVSFSAYRRLISNWMNRSNSDLESFLKQGLLSGVFVANYKITVNWPELADVVSAKGISGLAETVTHSGGQFLVEQGTTTFIQTVFFWLTFNKGIYKWEAMMSQSPSTSYRSRRTAALVAPAIYSVAGPVLTWASTSQEIITKLGPLDINTGQLALIGLTMASAGVSSYPEFYSAMMYSADKYLFEPWNRHVYIPSRRVKAWWRQLFR